MDIPATLMIAGPTAIVSLGAAWGGAKAALNGTRRRVRSLEEDLSEHKKDSFQNHIDAVERLARLETKIDMLLEKE